MENLSDELGHIILTECDNNLHLSLVNKQFFKINNKARNVKYLLVHKHICKHSDLLQDLIDLFPEHLSEFDENKFYEIINKEIFSLI